jgi:hypothetical protein
MRKNNIKNKKLKKKGSVLVYSLIILSIMLMGGLAISSAAILAMKGSISNDKSVQAFQLAESGLEIVLKDIKDTQDPTSPQFDNSYKIEDIANNSTDACGGAGECSASCKTSPDPDELQITFFGALDPNVVMKFEDDSPAYLDCDKLLSDVKRITSIGTFEGVSRAIGTIAGN